MKSRHFWFLVLGAFYALNAFSEPVIEDRSVTDSSSIGSANSNSANSNSASSNSDGSVSIEQTAPSIGNQSNPNPVYSAPAQAPAVNGGGSAQNYLDRINALEQDLQSLRGTVEELQNKLNQSDQLSTTRYMDVDRRLQAGGAPASAVVAPAPDASAAPNDGQSAPVSATGTGVDGGDADIPWTPDSAAGANPDAANQAAPAPAVDNSMNEKAAYDAAFDLVKKGKTEAAVKSFNGFLKTYPNGANAPLAWYWLGKLYSIDNLAKAKTSFSHVVEKYPTHPKASDSLYELASILEQGGQKTKAKSTLQRVVNEYPGSSAAGKAKQDLQAKYAK